MHLLNLDFFDLLACHSTRVLSGLWGVVTAWCLDCHCSEQTYPCQGFVSSCVFFRTKATAKHMTRYH